MILLQQCIETGLREFGYLHCLFNIAPALFHEFDEILFFRLLPNGIAEDIEGIKSIYTIWKARSVTAG